MDKFNDYTNFLFDELMYIDLLLEIHTFLKNKQVNKIDTLNIAPVFLEQQVMHCLSQVQ